MIYTKMGSMKRKKQVMLRSLTPMDIISSVVHMQKFLLNLVLHISEMVQ